MKKLFAVLLLICLSFQGKLIAQSFGDTIVVQTLEFSDITKRRGWYVFPEDTNQYHKILMYYTLKCDAATTQDGFPCGEWDYTTYTRLYQHENVGAEYYYLGNSNPDTIYYVNGPTYNVYQSYQYYPVYDNTVSESDYTIGSGSASLSNTLQSSLRSSKAQYIVTAAELTGAGVTAGDIHKLRMDISTLGADLDNLKIRIKNSALTELTPASYEMTGFTEVYNINTTFSSTGVNDFNFATPFNWDGTSNLVVEFTFENATAGADNVVVGEATGMNSGVVTNNDNGYLDFGSDEFVDVPAGAFANVSDEVTISFWCYGDPNVMPMNSYAFEGRDADGNRVLNSHLPWSNGRVYWDAGNNGTGSYDRLDEAANNANFSGQWNHWAFTKNATTGDMVMYLNGNVFATATGKTRTMSPIAKFRIGGTAGSGYSGRYDGFIDEFRVWNAELSQTDIQDWMYKTVDGTHPNYSNLQAAYDFNDLSGTVASDYSGNGHDGTLMGVPTWNLHNGFDNFMDIAQVTDRPNFTFVQGTYTMHLDSNLVNDTVYNGASTIIETSTYVDMNETGISSNALDTSYVWQPGYNYVYGPNGNAIDSTYITEDGMIINAYQQTIHQIQNYVTPYGIGLDLGPNGFRWVYDVTDYMPLFHDTVEISAGNQQELIDLKFIMIKGTPPRDVIDFETIWRGDYQHSNIANDISMPAVDVMMNPNASFYRIKTRTTGHWFGGFENCAEFCPKMHNLSINGTQQFEWLNWKTCANNPVVAQGGTWIYDRAGWCPGTFGDTYDHDITPFVTPGSTASIDYGMEYTAGGMEGNYRTTVQLVSYGEHNFTNDVALEDVIAPNNWEYHNRMNPICDNPKVLIKNTGSANLTSAVLNYAVCGDNALTYTWTGDLAYGETAEVELPIPDISFWDHAQFCKEFNVSVDQPNGVQDEYEYNNAQRVEFDSPPVYPGDFYIWFQTNGAASENTVTITDLDGNVHYSNSSYANNTQYKDTLSLAPGCYKFQITDSDSDGLAFFANNDGNGWIRFREVGGGNLHLFEPDFGDEITHYFTVGWGVSTPEYDKTRNIEVFPNPGAGMFNVEIDGFGDEVEIMVYDAQGKQISREVKAVENYFLKTQVDLEGMENGIYFIKVTDGKKTEVKQLIKQ